MENATSQHAVKSVFRLLKWTFVLVPIIAGADKFTNLLTHWEDYLSPGIVALLPFSAATFMMIVGVIEIIAGLIVLRNSTAGGYIVAAWLCLIAITLLAGAHYFDVAVRDLVMAIAAFSMAKTGQIVARGSR